jgi:hypothetical protein
MKTLFVTFGCSWTYGVGVGYLPGMSQEDYKKIAWCPEITNLRSFRGLLSAKFGLDNRNFAHGGSSNQRQFRLAKIFFTSEDFRNLQKQYDKIIVLHAITSTARTELFSNETNQLVNFKFDLDKSKLSEYYVKYSYNHKNEIHQLALEMLFWNEFYCAKNIKNIWVDTFNTHEYPCQIDNLFHAENTQSRDLLSQLAMSNGLSDLDGKYHLSSWVSDSNRVSFLLKKGIINPHSMHPTRLGHEQITELLSDSIKKLLS